MNAPADTTWMKGLSVRVASILRAYNITQERLQELLTDPEGNAKLLKLQNLGPGALRELQEWSSGVKFTPSGIERVVQYKAPDGTIHASHGAARTHMAHKAFVAWCLQRFKGSDITLVELAEAVLVEWSVTRRKDSK